MSEIILGTDQCCVGVIKNSVVSIVINYFAFLVNRPSKNEINLIESIKNIIIIILKLR